MKKKVLKIIQIVYDILSLGFIIFISVALSVVPKVDGQSHQDSPSTLIYEKKYKKNAYISEGGYIYTLATDIGGQTFLNGLFEYLKINDNYDVMKVPTYSQSSSHLSQSSQSFGRICEWYKVDFENPNRSVTYATINGFELVFNRTSNYIDFDVSIGNGYRARIYEMTFYLITNGNRFTNTYLKYNAFYVFNRSNEVVSASFFQLDLVKTDTYLVVWDSQHINNTILVDMVNGGKENSNYIYQQGYSKGYIAGSSGLNSNVFTAIGQAFSAVSNIFSIEVIPGFPLWVLIFAPLVVTIVIVVVKMIKG